VAGKKGDVALEIPLAALAVARRRKRGHSALARIEHPGDGVDRPALSCRVAPLEDDHDPLAGFGKPTRHSRELLQQRLRKLLIFRVAELLELAHPEPPLSGVCDISARERQSPAMHRLFVAIRPPEPIRDLLIDAMDDSPDLRWAGDEQLHLTLRFIGEVERPLANDIADALAAIRFPAFELRVAGVGRFDRRSGGALWAAAEPRKPVTELAAKVDRACVAAGLEPERRAFHPHITLPRRSVDRFTLFESHLSRHGAHYEEIAEFELAL
jgi:2'-5' RNA ligase